MKNKNPLVTVVILTKNAGVGFNSVLSSVFRQLGVNFEVLVIDSGSSDSTISTANQFPVKLVQIKPDDFGHGRTRNLAAKLANGKFVVFLTHDAKPKNNRWLSNLIKPFTDSTVAGVFGRQIPRKNENILDKIFFLTLYGDKKVVWTKGTYSSGDNIFSDANGAIKKSLLVKHPYKNDIIVSEDYEWANRIMQLGRKIVYEPKAVVIHSHSYNLYSLFKRNFDIGISYKYIANFNSNKKLLSKGLKLTGNEFVNLINAGKPYLIFSSLFRNTVRFLAITLGKNESILPIGIKKNYLSSQKWYWI